MIDFNNYPAVTQQQPRAGLSQRYRFVPTTQIVEDLAKQGWNLNSVQEATARTAARNGWQKHVLRFRNPNFKIDMLESFPEIVVVNSHDGSTAFQLMAGLFRLVCSNGLIVADSMFGNHHIKHVGYTADKVFEAVTNILITVPRIAERIEEFSAVELSSDERGVYAMAACEAKHGKTEGYDVNEILRPHRKADAKPSLWHTYNVVQENLINGNTYRIGRADMIPVAPVKSVHKNIHLNQQLWSMAEKMAEFKRDGIVILPKPEENIKEGM